jgi:hypothetical protein
MSRIWRRKLAAEGGSIMVEVLIGTVLLALTTAAVLDGLDGAQETGRLNKDRSTAATLAQQDLERLRSMPPELLVNLHQARTVDVAGVPYAVVSRTDPVTDASGLVSCTTDETNAEYLRLSSTVNAPASHDRPVTATSLLSPPLGTLDDDGGTAAVKLTDRDGEPLEGVGVDLVGPASHSNTTNDVGCAVFAFIAPGDWVAEVDGDLVTWDGESPAQSSVTVAADKTSLTQIELDEPASLRATFVTPDGAPTAARSIGVANAKLTNGYRAFPVGDYASSKDADRLFPFHDGYGVFAGDCEANNPAIWESDYFETSGHGFVELDPGELLGAVQVVVPQLHVTVERDGDSYADAQIYVQQVDDDYDCEDVVYNSGVTDVDGTSVTFDVPLPFGRYQVCAATRTSSVGSWRRRFTGSGGAPSNPNLRTPPLDRSIAIDADGSGSSGCTATPPA